MHQRLSKSKAFAGEPAPSLSRGFLSWLVTRQRRLLSHRGWAHRGGRTALLARQLLTRSARSRAGKDLVAALQHAFHEVETEFLNTAGREGLRDGTTAVVALVQEDTLTLAHVGDSRGVLCRGGKAVELTHDHKPVRPARPCAEGAPRTPLAVIYGRPSWCVLRRVALTLRGCSRYAVCWSQEIEAEKRRIESLGGFVSYIGCWRAMGILAMSRAIGDLFLKVRARLWHAVHSVGGHLPAPTTLPKSGALSPTRVTPDPNPEAPRAHHATHSARRGRARQNGRARAPALALFAACA